MNNIIEQMLSKYEIKNTTDEINALKEIIQEIVLAGLSRGNFFNEVAFYGGTALRIFYNLDRFSEDLDFALIKPNKNFDLSKYFSYIEKELKAYGINLQINTKVKSIDSNITSAFLKGDTLEHILKFFPNEDGHKYNQILKNLKIQFEVDINPPMGATYENKYKLLPSPHLIKLYDKPSLLAGKIHAILCRSYKNNVKGRDYYDFLFYMRQKIKPNMNYLRNKLIETQKLKENDYFDINVLKNMLMEKIESIDFNQVKNDAQKFIFKNENLEYFSKELFVDMIKRL